MAFKQIEELVRYQDQKYLTVNEGLRALRILAQITVVSAAVTTPPTDASEGDAYIVAAGSTDAWNGMDGQIAYYSGGAWKFLAPETGFLAYDQALAGFYYHDGAAWTELTTSGSGGSGDMTTATYDPDADGVVEDADSARALDDKGGNTASVAEIRSHLDADPLPDQVGHGGQFLKTDGGAADWSQILEADIADFGSYEAAGAVSGHESAHPHGDYDAHLADDAIHAGRIAADTTIHVSTTGNDTTGDGSSGAPFATPHKALEHLADFRIAPGVTATVQLAAGTYTDLASIVPQLVYGAQVIIKGAGLSQTILRFTGDGLAPRSAINIEDCALEANTTGTGTGISLTSPYRVGVANVKLSNFSKGSYIANGGQFSASGLEVVGCDTGLQGDTGAQLLVPSAVITSTTGTAIYLSGNCFAAASSVSIDGATDGIRSLSNSFCNAYGGVFANVSTWEAFAQSNSFIHMGTTTSDDAKISPTPNTVGNLNSIVIK
jgi:hypothetical protein